MMIIISLFLWFLAFAFLLGLNYLLRKKKLRLKELKEVNSLMETEEYVQGIKDMVLSYLKRTMPFFPPNSRSYPPVTDNIEEYYGWFHEQFAAPLLEFRWQKSAKKTMSVLLAIAILACLGMGLAFLVLAQDVYLRGLLLILPLEVFVIGIFALFFRIAKSNSDLAEVLKLIDTRFAEVIKQAK